MPIALIASAGDIDVRFVRRAVLSERGEVQMIILEAPLRTRAIPTGSPAA